MIVVVLMPPTFYNSLVAWASSKQKVVTRSISKQNMVPWLLLPLSWFGSNMCFMNFISPFLTCLLRHNVSATCLSINPIQHARIKHVELDWHFLRNQVNAGTLDVQFTPTNEQLADALTKAQPKALFCSLHVKLMVVPPPSIWEDTRLGSYSSLVFYL